LLERYVRGGVPISLPEKDAPFEKFDYGLGYIFYNRRQSCRGDHPSALGGNPAALTPVQVPPDTEYVPD